MRVNLLESSVQRARPGEDHWDALARELRHQMCQLSDERLQALYQELYRAGWATLPSYPLTTRDAAYHLRHAMMQAVSAEWIKRDPPAGEVVQSSQTS